MARRRGPFGASFVSILNADARSDEEARSRAVRFFGWVLVIFYVLDIGCALAILLMECRQNEEHQGVASCIKITVLDRGFFHANKGLEDFFLMAIIRCFLTSFLLMLGIRYGRHEKQDYCWNANTSNTSDSSTGSSVRDTLEEPLLLPFSDASHDTRNGNVGQNATSSCLHGCTKIDAEKYRTIMQVLLFVTSTFYQVYAGLGVAIAPQNGGDDHSTTLDVVILSLACLTVFWVNAEAYVFRTLLAEITRDAGLFLPPEIHRHPVYFVSSRGLAGRVFCDLCSQRIKQKCEGGGCYRCALCDFNMCLPCSKRNDAAIVGENMMRSDQGVRAQTSLSDSGYIQRSFKMARQELPLLLLSLVLMAASSVSSLLLPHYQGHIIDKVIPDEAGNYDKVGFLKYIHIYIFVMLAKGALSTLKSAIFTLVSRRLKFNIRNKLFEKILAQDVAYFDGTESGRLISRLTNDLDLMMAPIQSALSKLLSNILILFGGMVMCFLKSYRLSMLAFVTVGPISYLWEQYSFWSKGLAREMLSHWAEGNSIAAQALSHIRTVKAFGCEEQVVGNYSDINGQALSCGIKDAWGNAITSGLTGYLDLGSGVMILYFGGLLVYRGEITVGELVTFQLFWNMMNGAYQNLQGLITSFTRSAAGAEKVFSLWDSVPDIDPTEGEDVSWAVKGDLELCDVSFHYQMRPDNIVLKGFGLKISAGKTVALVGRSGGGKSTIINLLLRFYDPKHGRLLLDGREYNTLKVHQLRRLFGAVTQETELFATTVEENIAYGLNQQDYTMEDVIEAAKKAHAHEFICEMKDGYQTRVGERGGRLSGGQRQRLAIARVFLRKPKIILLDEATSALDENSQESVQRALQTLIDECNATVVLVAHRLSTVINADSICVIDKGTVLEQGNHEELLSKGGIYASMVEKQMKKKADLIDQDGKTSGLNGSGKGASADDIDTLMAVDG
mmetsp:Transcript_2129/g.3141  ORF Transcript_2129/g.3141 Transcript_2129/m.3141 type:complete len:954 (+) Transcript_2129:131-2992(+)|eukprot:CAMPEP_0194203654 /NCGR_PEP_ID=MMETSP0156-20130528/3367_1 /TAXON_ID=33649 /ORGANISM="Thalassionema nitzschioides, Strain L26-B" /LENGTH=953 /DNA_ID=CAMNT_0038929443 /DNA_START=26 /DNA_END=2887 /DNA_ORIENTATION=-